MQNKHAYIVGKEKKIMKRKDKERKESGAFRLEPPKEKREKKEKR